jgi:DNA-directed RNA polymerase specialized sigma24 family protein
MDSAVKSHSSGVGTKSEFTTTHWSEVFAAGHEESGEGGHALGDLCRTYWYPLYTYARRTGRSAEDSQDLTQGFFEHLLESHLLASANAAKGRFRAFLLRCFRNFMTTQYLKASCEKRGGGKVVLSLDAEGAEAKFGKEAADPRSPEVLFERAWAIAVLDAAMRRVEEEFVTSGRGRIFRVLCPHLQGDDDSLPHAVLARKLATTEVTVRVMVYRLRRRYREALNTVVLRTVESPAEVDEELRHLLRVLQS